MLSAKCSQFNMPSTSSLHVVVSSSCGSSALESEESKDSMQLVQFLHSQHSVHVFCSLLQPHLTVEQPVILLVCHKQGGNGMYTVVWEWKCISIPVHVNIHVAMNFRLDMEFQL